MLIDKDIQPVKLHNPFESSEIRPLPTVFRPLVDRSISSETAKKYGVTVGSQSNPDLLHIYPYFDKSGNHVANKVRYKNKEFSCEGSMGAAILFGQQVFPVGQARAVTIVEGECDALAAFEMQGSKYPVVSIRGASSAQKDITNSFEWLNSFEQIYLCFDSDKAGKEAAQKVAPLFAIGKVKIVNLKEFKDANDYLKAGKSSEFMKEWWAAAPFTPDGLKLGSSLWDEIASPKNYETVSYPWTGLDKQTYGIRLSEFVLVTADRKVGKTSLIKEIVHHILKCTTAGVGLMLFEETNSDTGLGLMSVEASKRLHLPDVRASVTTTELRKYYDDILNTDRVVIWDHFGSNAVGEVLNKIRHMAALGCKYIVLDHLSIVVSDQSGDERKQLDEISTKVKTLCMELNIAVLAVIHQSRTGVISGSAGPEQLANIVIKLHRDVLSDDEHRRNITKVVIEANRFTGDTGPSSYLYWDRVTGRMSELTPEQVTKYENKESFEMWG